MIDIKELRIGNLLFDENKLLFTVFDIHFNKEGKYRISQGQIYGYDTWAIGYVMPEILNPIPLTPEILEKCGFNKTITEINYSIGKGETIEEIKGVGYLKGQAHKVYPLDDKWILVKIIDSKKSWEVGTTFKYLHQLQNLYFALTGEELTCTL